jgi:hypothetical protein
MRGVLKSRKVIHHPMIRPEELPKFLQVLTTSDIHTTTKLAIQFTILTAARSGEVRGLPGKKSTSKNDCGRSQLNA